MPLELSSAWPTSPWDVGSLVDEAVRLKSDQLRRLSELVKSLPVQLRGESVPPDNHPEGPGALLLRLMKNRNIRPYNAKALLFVGGGPYVSASTVAMPGQGMAVMTPQYVTAFAHLLGYAPADMVALAGVGPVENNLKVHPAHAVIAALAWSARQLGSDRIAHVVAAARELR